MKLIIRDLSSQCICHPGPSLVVPFVLFAGSGGHRSPVWLTPTKLDAALNNPEEYGKLIRMAAWGKPIARHQTLAEYCSLDRFHLNSATDTHLAGMLGLREMLIAGAFGDEKDAGEAFLVRVSSPVWNHDLVGVWADSKQAAKQFCREVVKETNLEEASKGFPDCDIYDFEKC